MIPNILSVLPLLSLTVATPQWTQPNACISRLLKTAYTPFIPTESMNNISEHLHKDLRLFERQLAAIEQQMSEHAEEVDELASKIFRFRANTLTYAKEDFHRETQLIAKIFHKSYDNCLTGGRPKINPGETHIDEPLTPTLKTHDIIKSYEMCIRNFQGENHVDRLKHELLQSIANSQNVKSVQQLEEFRARLMSAGRADFAKRHAHRIRCFMTTHEGVKLQEQTVPSDPIKTLLTWTGKGKLELEKELRNIEENREEAEKDLANWKKRQTEVVRQLFDDLLKQNFPVNVLESQEDRLNALLLMAGMEKIDAEKSKQQFLISTDNVDIDKLHANVHHMMQEYLKCMNTEKPKTQWSRELRRELAEEIHNSSSKKSESAKERAIFEYFWERHLIVIELDFATEMAASVTCFAKTEQKMFF